MNDQVITDDQAARIMRDAMRDAIKRHSLWYMLQGILMIVAGVAALIFPLFSSVAVVLVLAGKAAPYGAIGLLLAAAVLGWWQYREVPPSFVLAPREPDAASAAIGDYGGRPFPALPIVLLRGLTAGAKEISFLPFIVLCGFILGGGFEVVTDEPFLRDMRFMWIPMVAYMLFAFMGPKLGSLHHLDPLPVSRRILFAALIAQYHSGRDPGDAHQ